MTPTTGPMVSDLDGAVAHLEKRLTQPGAFRMDDEQRLRTVLDALARRAVGEGGENDALIADLRRFHDDCTPGRMDYALSDGLAFALEKAINRLAAIRSPE